jgi:hypothetical protein
MTRKDYEMIAKAIRETRDKVALESGNNADVMAGANAGLYELSRILCNELYMQNPRFNEDKFLTACETLWN